MIADDKQLKHKARYRICSYQGVSRYLQRGNSLFRSLAIRQTNGRSLCSGIDVAIYTRKLAPKVALATSRALPPNQGKGSRHHGGSGVEILAGRFQSRVLSQEPDGPATRLLGGDTGVQGKANRNCQVWKSGRNGEHGTTGNRGRDLPRDIVSGHVLRIIKVEFEPLTSEVTGESDSTAKPEGVIS